MGHDMHWNVRREIIDTCLRMNALGINQGTSGNVSARVGDKWLITPSGIPYEKTTPEQIVELEMEGGYYGNWLPSSEWMLHHDIYRKRPEAKAVIHTHSTYATALACLRREVPAFHYMIAVAGGNSLRCARYETFGTRELSEAMIEAMEGRTACLLANHGQICFGPSLEKALWLANEIETLCRQYHLACLAGEPVILDDEEMNVVLARFRSYGKQPGEMKPGDPPAVESPPRLDA